MEWTCEGSPNLLGVGADGNPIRYQEGAYFNRYANEWMYNIKLGGTAEGQAFVPFIRGKGFFYFSCNTNAYKNTVRWIGSDHMKGRFGIHCGQYMPETLMNTVMRSIKVYCRFQDDSKVQKEPATLLKEHAKRLSLLCKITKEAIV